MKQTTAHQNHSLIEIHASNHSNQMIRFSIRNEAERTERERERKKSFTLIVANERLVFMSVGLAKIHRYFTNKIRT